MNPMQKNDILKRIIQQKMGVRMKPSEPKNAQLQQFQQKIQEIQKHIKVPQKLTSNKIPVYIGMTTIPERLRKLRTQQAIASILQNSVKPEKIIVSIPSKTLKGEEYSEDLFSHPIFKHPLVHIHRMEKDEGPILKLNGLLDWIKKNPNPSIHNFVLMDDDIIYSVNQLSHLWNLHLRFPNASLGYAGRSYDPKTNKLNFLILHQSKVPLLPVYVIESYHLALHPLSHFLENDWNEFVKMKHQECPESIFTDDILISLYDKKKNIPRFIFQGPKIKVNHFGTQKLSDTNLSGRNLFVYQKIWNTIPSSLPSTSSPPEPSHTP